MYEEHVMLADIRPADPLRRVIALLLRGAAEECVSWGGYATYHPIHFAGSCRHSSLYSQVP